MIPTLLIPLDAMKHALLVLLLAPPLQAADPLVDFTWGGGKSPIVTANVRVDPAGKVDVRYRKQEKAEATHSFALTDDELSALRTLIRVSKLNGVAVSRPDAGDSTLIVSGRTVKNPDGPLVEALWRLVNQGVVTTELEADVYQARNALTPLAAAAKVYCPRLLADPLKKVLAASNNKQHVEWGLEGLSYVLSEEQWSGFVGDQVEKAGRARRTMLLAAVTGHPFHANVPQGHAKALLPLLAAELDAAADDAHGAICRYIADHRYEPARPVLERLKAAGGTSAATRWAAWALDNMKPKKADAGLKGTWLPVSTVKEGVLEPGKGVKVVITDDALEYVYDNGETNLVYGLAVDPEKKHLTLKDRGFKPLDVLALYDLDGDSLRICYADGKDRDKNRPADFTARVGSRQVLVTLKREGGGPVRVMKAMDGFRKKLPEPQGLGEMNGIGLPDIDGSVHPDTHLKGIGVRLGVTTRAECMVLLTYLKDPDPKIRRIAAFALEGAVKAYPNGMSSDDIQKIDSDGHRKMVAAFIAGIEKLPK